MPKTDNKPVTVRRLRNRMIVFFSVVMTVIIFGIIIYTFLSVRSTSYNDTADYINAIDVRYLSEIDSFTKNAESDCNSVYRNENIMSYDPIENDYPEYESTTIKNEVKNELLSLSAGKSYNDFLLLFSDSSSVGKVSSGASEIFTRYGFELFDDELSESSDMWLFYLNESGRKIYYLRRISDHCIFMLSCYVDVLESTLEINRLDSKNLFMLTDEEGNVIISSSDDVASGEKAPSKYTDIFNTQDSESVITNEYIAASLVTDCGWRVITLVNSPRIIALSWITMGGAIVLVMIIFMICALTGACACAKYSLADLNNPDSELTDPLTGKLNEYGLDERISELLETSIVGSTYAFILLQVKDSDQIKQSVSLSMWNGVRKKLALKAQDFFSDRKCYIGRVYEDKIAIFVDYSEFDLFKAHENLKDGCLSFCQSFSDFTVGEQDDFKLNVSVGACIYPDHAEDFDELLEKAQCAVKQAEAMSENAFVIYDPKNDKGEERTR